MRAGNNSKAKAEHSERMSRSATQFVTQLDHRLQFFSGYKVIFLYKI